MTEPTLEALSPGPPEQSKPSKPDERPSAPLDSAVPTTGRRAALRDVRRQLTDKELQNPGVNILLLDMLQEADDERASLRPYIDRFHEADKNAAILTERMRSYTKIEVFFGVGMTLGGSIIGLVPFFLSEGTGFGVVTGLIGLTLLTGSIVGRAVKK